MPKSNNDDTCRIAGCSRIAKMKIAIFAYEVRGEKKYVYANVCNKCYAAAHSSRKEAK